MLALSRLSERARKHYQQKFHSPLRKGALASLLVIFVASNIWMGESALGAGANNFVQTNWSGGSDSGVGAVHPEDQTGRTTFSSATNTTGTVSVGNVILSASDFTATDDGTLTTTGVATGGGFSNGSTSSTTVSGSGSSASAGLTRTSTPANTFESAIPAVPSNVGTGGGMINNGDGSIFVLQGDGTTGFFKYSISGNVWTTLATVPSAVGVGAKIIRNGTDDEIYVLRGDTTTSFFRYSISGNSWTTLTSTPVAIRDGSSMIRNSNDDHIYVVRGGNGSGFYRYSISGNSWTTLTNTPSFVGSGGTLLRNGSDNDIYLLHGGSDVTFSRYSISGNSWTSLTVVPGAVGAGGTIIRNGGEDFIYALRGGATTGFFRYSITGNSWTTLTAVPSSVVTSAANLLRNGTEDFIYLLRGSSTDLLRYSITGNAWTTLAAAPGSGGLGSTMTRNGSDNEMYVTQGGSSNGFFVYSISGNSWNGSGVSGLAAIPGTIGAGSNLLRNSDDDEVFVIRGGNTTDFYRFSIAGNSWTTLTSLPFSAGSNGGNLIRRDGENDIYWLQGGNNTGFFKYSITGNSWTTLAVTPAAVNGGMMFRDGNSDHIYVVRAGGSTDFFRYSISGNSWTTLAVIPGTVPAGGKLIVRGNDIFLLRTNNSTDFFRYSISGNSWTTLAAIPSAVGSGSGNNLLRYNDDNEIYLIKGDSSTSFFSYSISGNSWTTLATTPSSITTSSSMVRYANDNNIYVTRGGGLTGFFSYSISGNSWTTLTSVPGTVSTGSAMINGGIEDQIYLLQGNSTANLWRYNINTITHPASGTLTSAVIDTAGAASFGNASWTATLPRLTTLTFATRTGNTAIPDGTWSAWSAELSNSAGSAITSPAARYLQYRASFATTKTTVSSTLSDVTFAYSAYSSSGELISSAYDTQSSSNKITEISWIEDSTLPTGSTVTVSMRSAVSSGGLSGSWTDFTNATVGCTKDTGTVTCPSDALPEAFQSDNDDQFLQYKIAFTTTNFGLTPTISEVAIGYGSPTGGLHEGTITVSKVIINDDGGTATADQFSLFVNEQPVLSGVTGSFPAPADAYVITGTKITGYSQSFSGDCDITGRLTLVPGENKSCVVTNNDIATPPSSAPQPSPSEPSSPPPSSSQPPPSEPTPPPVVAEEDPVTPPLFGGNEAEPNVIIDVPGEPFIPTETVSSVTSIDDDKNLIGIPFSLAPCISGSLIVVDDPKTDVYYCGRDGQRYVFADHLTFLTWFPNPVVPQSISFDRMASIPIGGIVTPRPGVKILRFPLLPFVYAIEPGGVLRRIPDEATAASIYGPNWPNFMLSLSEALLTNFKFGDSLPSVNQ